MPRVNLDRPTTQYRRFNDWLRGERRARKVRQSEIADYLGISQQAYSQKETSVSKWDFMEVLKIMDFFGESLEGIL